MQNSSPKNHDETEGKMNQFLLVLKIRTRFADECYTLFIITLSLRSTVHKINAKRHYSYSSNLSGDGCKIEYSFYTVSETLQTN